jgi:RNA polymerase sigma-70 factor (ECF subfamily)
MALEWQTDEYQLLERMAARDEGALARLYDRYAPAMFGLALKLLGSREEAEEVVLETFSQAWNSAGGYDRARGRVDAWLFMITRSRALDHLRARARASRTNEALEQAVTLELPRVADPEEDVLLAERRREVLSALGALPTSQRSALELVYYEGLSHAEVAERTGEPLGTVKTRIRLGLSKLRDLLAGR